MNKNLYRYRFELFLLTQFFTLFGSLFFDDDFFEKSLLPALFLLNIGSGIVMISKRRKLMWLFIAFFAIAAFNFGSDLLSAEPSRFTWSRLMVYFIFNIVVTWNIIEQVWKEKDVDRKVIFGLMSGYISLGFLAFFLFISIEITYPGSLKGFMNPDADAFLKGDAIMYYAFVTLMTIGYGDIVPAAPIARKASMLVGLVGQFYVIIVTGIVMGKYIDGLKLPSKK
ncbi:MAG: potassium channel family protein [Flavobacteriales bacterium]|nr:potassium channel family protein [Flavobacteriales bacterium]